MVMKHINITNRYFFIALIIFVNLFCTKLTSVMGDDLRTHRDSGVIGEKKTIEEAKIYRDKITGATYQFHKHGTFITPRVIGDVAYFNLNYDYSFNFKCLNWKYNLKAYWSSADAEERTGFLASLVSPDKKTVIDVKEIDVPVNLSLATMPTQEQLNILQSQSYVEDPFVGDERILAAQQAIQWVLDKNLDGYEITSDGRPVKFTIEHINNKDFVKTEINVFSKKENITKKCVIWALNRRGYRLRDANIRRMYTWICQVISDPSVYSDIAFKARMIPETLDLNPVRTFFADTKE